MPLIFCGEEENKNAVMESMAHRGFKLKQMEPPSTRQYPLLMRANQQVEFVSWRHRNMNTLAEELPPLEGGASPWIRLFEKLTAEDNLALGDVRALIIRREGEAKLTMLEAETKTANKSDEEPFNRHRGNFWAGMKVQWPTKLNMTVLTGIRKKAGEDICQYLRRAEDDWHSTTGERHDKDPATTMVWRHIVQKGLLLPVQAKLDEVVGLNSMDNLLWREHLTHYDQRHTDAEASEEDDLNKLTLRWLKIQVAKAETKAHKKKQQAPKQMTVTKAPQPLQTGGRGQGYGMDRYNEVDRYDHSAESFSQMSGEPDADDSVLFGQLKGTVVGLRYYTGEVNQGEKVSLVREPQNPYDCDAVMVDNIYGDHVGHIKWELAAAMAYVMDNNLAEVEGVEHYGKKNPYTMPLMLSFWGKEENKYDVIESMADYGFKLKEMEPPSTRQYPLLMRANQQVEFVSWRHRNMNTLAEELPPLEGGASPWIRLFEKLTAEDNLALGDVRALIIRREGEAKLTMLEAETKTANKSDEEPFNRHRGNFWAGMKVQWPTKLNMTVSTEIRKRAGEDMYQYLRRAEEEWHSTTGERHDKDPATTMVWRPVVQKGLPLPVQAKLDEVVGLNSMDNLLWREHLTHYDQRHTEASEEDNLKKLRLRLLKIQVAKAETEAHKKRQQAPKQMTVTKAPQPLQTGGRGQGYGMDRYNEVDRYDHSAESFSQMSGEPNADDGVLFGQLKGTVVGLRYYTGEVNQGEKVSLVREPQNPYDCDAVMVDNIYGDHVGHIKWELAAAMAYVMDNNLAEVEGVEHYGKKNPYTMPLMLSFWGKEENKYDVIESMADYGFKLKEMEPPSTRQYEQGRGYQAGGYGQPGNQEGSSECYLCGGWGHWARDCRSQQGEGMQFRGAPPRHRYSPSYPQNQW